MVGEFTIKLVELKPESAVMLHTFNQTIHRKIGLAQSMDKLGCIINRLIQILEFMMPVAFSPLTNPHTHLAARDSTIGH